MPQAISTILVRTLALAASLTVAACSTTANDSAEAATKPEVHTKEIVSKSHTIDQIYLSMEGPTDTQKFSLLDGPERELVWLTATEVEILDGEGNKTSDEHLCHSNLYFTDFKQHHERFDRKITADQKFVDVNQGLTEVRFPEGFGFPVLSNEPLVFHSMVISPAYAGEPFDLAVRTTFEFLRDTDLDGSIQPLSQRGVQLRIPVGNYDGQRQPQVNPEACSPEHETHAEHIGQLADSATEKVFTQTDIQKRFDGADGVVLPGGFAHGDYLRTGAIARFSPVMAEVERLAGDGTPILGICNGFQILCESGLLPGALVANRDLKFICKPVHVRVESTDSIRSPSP